MDKLKTRFAPSPTGYLHVGGARTALFSYVMARKTGGAFVLRIEDTDLARHDEASVEKITRDLRWLGIEWDEGVEVGGPAGSYRQSERLDIYRRYARRLLEEGRAYYAFDTAGELDTMRQTAQDQKRTFRYPRPSSLPSEAQAEEARDAARPVVVRFLCPDADVSFHDDAFGQVVMPGAETDDFIILKGDGYPTYHLANVVDDALMGINYIMRGQEFLAQTWRHKLLREALGFDEPGYCHLPLILDMKGRKLSKRDGDVEVNAFRQAGFLPETMVNFIALLGWNPGGDREKFTLTELVDLFSVERIGKSNPKFDRDKLLAFNTAAVAAAPADRLLECFKDYLSLNPGAPGPIPAADDALLRRVLEANRGFHTFADIPARCGVLFAPDDAFDYDDDALAKVLRKNDQAGYKVLQDVRDRLAACDWTAEALEHWMRNYCQAKGLGMGKVAQPIRAAVTGKTISPAVFDTLLLLGRDKTLARIDRCLAMR